MRRRRGRARPVIANISTEKRNKDKLEGTICKNCTGLGGVLVQAYAASRALPLEDVTVKISGAKGEGSFTYLTNINGKTPVLDVVAPNKDKSTTPGAYRPFSSINIIASKDGYYTNEYKNVQIFDDVLTIQDAQMIPLSEKHKGNDDSRIYVTTPQNLGQGGGGR